MKVLRNVFFILLAGLLLNSTAFAQTAAIVGGAVVAGAVVVENNPGGGEDLQLTDAEIADVKAGGEGATIAIAAAMSRAGIVLTDAAAITSVVRR